MSNQNFAEKLKKYADVIVQVGINLQPGQRLLIRTHGMIEATAPLIRAVTKSAYESGARFVDVVWGDEAMSIIRYENAPADSFSEFPNHLVNCLMEYAENGDASLSITAGNPDALAGQDQAKMALVRKVTAEKTMEFGQFVSKMEINWCGVGAASAGWAAKVFPEDSSEKALEHLWEAIFKLTRLDLDDPVQAWKDHVAKLTERKTYLNDKQYSTLHLTAPGTDLKVDLAQNHIWMGGSVQRPDGVAFVPNLPTEEVFTTPHNRGTNGTISASLPLNMNGVLIEGLKFTFKDGKITDFSADTGMETIQKLLEMDDGAGRLGEIALVPNSSPIAQSGTLFYNTLYDENASNHLAIGRAYAVAVKDGATMNEEQKQAAGVNHSLIHIDFMVGSDQMNVDGITADGTMEPVMRNGEWAF
jgi:aminopeptidase